MLAFIFRGVFLVGILSWYSTSVWKMIDTYFKNRFQSYLKAEYDKNPHMLADLKAYRAAGGKESNTVVSTPDSEDLPLKEIIRTCETDVCPTVNKTSDSEQEELLPLDKKNFTSNDTGADDHVKLETANATTEPPPIWKELDTNESKIVEESPKPVTERLKNDTAKKRNTETKKGKRQSARVSATTDQTDKPKPAKKNKVKIVTFTEKDFASTRIKVTPQDFAEFDVDEDSPEHNDGEPLGILVSELPVKPKLNIGDLRRVSPEEFCPVTLEDEFSCDETKTWP
ncbi:uncharacterized protein LOC105687610 [Athalia rosae]|uniref:uncharacterized protein LOC105687610 n=1 Tax=Athalia rosae TaxID=37344 RepID=UPI002033AC5D|nr:uncharacterized protein LOC105687610 [Athalia rosae]